MTTRPVQIFLLGILVASVTGLFPFPAFAQACASDGTISNIFCSIGKQFQLTPKFLAVLSYAGALVLTLTGLLNLKSYGDDPTSVPMRSIVIKFVLASLLIALPYAMQLAVGTVTGAKRIDQNTALSGRPCLSKDSGLMELRNTQMKRNGAQPCG